MTNSKRQPTSQAEPLPGKDRFPRSWLIDPSVRREAMACLWMCEALSRTVRFDAAAVVATTSVDARAQLVGSDPELRRFGDLQQTVREGPGVDVLRTAQPVIVADLHDCAVRWPVLAGAGVGDLAVRSLVLFPLMELPIVQVQSPVPYALLAMARRQVEPLDDHEIAVLDAASRLIGLSLLDQFGPADEAGRHSSAVLKTDDVAVATGMTMRRLRVDSDTALTILRAHAFATNTTVHDLASQMVAGKADPLSAS